jgi:hypothetical protein
MRELAIEEDHPTRPVTEALANAVKRYVETEFDSRVVKVSTEIQDGCEFLRVSMSLDGAVPVSEALKMLELTSTEVSRRLPLREDDYSWIVNIEYGGAVLRSASGGWKGQPNV